jgi:hypothetical protein
VRLIKLFSALFMSVSQVCSSWYSDELWAGGLGSIAWTAPKILLKLEILHNIS